MANLFNASASGCEKPSTQRYDISLIESCYVPDAPDAGITAIEAVDPGCWPISASMSVRQGSTAEGTAQVSSTGTDGDFCAPNLKFTVETPCPTITGSGEASYDDSVTEPELEVSSSKNSGSACSTNLHIKLKLPSSGRAWPPIVNRTGATAQIGRLYGVKADSVDDNDTETGSDYLETVSTVNTAVPIEEFDMVKHWNNWVICQTASLADDARGEGTNKGTVLTYVYVHDTNYEFVDVYYESGFAMLQATPEIGWGKILKFVNSNGVEIAAATGVQIAWVELSGSRPAQNVYSVAAVTGDNETIDPGVPGIIDTYSSGVPSVLTEGTITDSRGKPVCVTCGTVKDEDYGVIAVSGIMSVGGQALSGDAKYADFQPIVLTTCASGPFYNVGASTIPLATPVYSMQFPALPLSTDPGAALNEYVIDRTSSANDAKGWDPVNSLPADWYAYDCVTLVTDMLRYDESAGTLEHVPQSVSWPALTAPRIAAVSPASATVITCDS